MPMIAANMFWLETLHQCNLDHSLSLPYDRYRLANEQRTGHAISISFNFDQDLSNDFISYASLNNFKVEYLLLTTYYMFLFKLTNGERDLCIGMNINNRYKDELKSIIGLFDNIIPLRCQLDPYWSFDKLIKYVYIMIENSLKYSYYPFQRILDQHSLHSKPSFINISFKFHCNETGNMQNKSIIGDTELHSMRISTQRTNGECANKFDFSLTIFYDMNINKLLCTISGSLNLFYEETIHKITQRFHSILKQIFISNQDNQTKKPMYELSLLLSHERILIDSINNTQILFPSVSSIHHQFIDQGFNKRSNHTFTDCVNHFQNILTKLPVVLVNYAGPCLVPSLVSLKLIQKLTKNPVDALALTRAVESNPTIEMNLTLWKLTVLIRVDLQKMSYLIFHLSIHFI